MEFAFVITLSAILGIIFHFLDSRTGTKINRGWYNLTHKEKQAPEDSKGFIFKRKFGARLTFSLFIAVIAFLVLTLIDSVPFFQGFLYSLTGLLGILLGIYISSLFIKKGGKSLGDAIDYIEKIESGETNIKKDLLKGAMDVRDEIKNISKEREKEKIRKEVKKEIEEDTLNEKKKTEENKNEEENKDWRKGIDDFLNK